MTHMYVITFSHTFRESIVLNFNSYTRTEIVLCLHGQNIATPNILRQEIKFEMWYTNIYQES